MIDSLLIVCLNYLNCPGTLPFFEIVKKRSSLSKCDKNVKLFVVGIDLSGECSELIVNYWDPVSDAVVSINEHTLIGPTVAKLVGQELGYRAQVLTSGEVFIEPNLELTMFSIFKPNADTPVTIYYPNQYDELLEVKASSDFSFSYQIEDLYEFWVIHNPPSGTWFIRPVADIDVVKYISSTSTYSPTIVPTP